VTLLLLITVAGTAVAGPSNDGVAAYNRGDYATAYRLLRPLAEHGDAEAQFYLGVQYNFGYGVPQSYDEAAKWYRKAADQGDATAQFNLGKLYAAVALVAALRYHFIASA
jgi:uncharacterized protein